MGNRPKIRNPSQKHGMHKTRMRGSWLVLKSGSTSVCFTDKSQQSSQGDAYGLSLNMRKPVSFFELPQSCVYVSVSLADQAHMQG